MCQRSRHRWRCARNVVKIDNEIVPEVKAARFLGIWINRKGSFLVHRAKIKEALFSRINCLKALAFKADRNILWRIGNAVCVSKLMYGIELFGLNLLNTFQSTYNEILRITSGALRSSPTLSLAVEAGQLPLHLRLVDTLARRYIRLAEKPFFNHQHLRKCAIEAFADETGHDIPEIAKLLWIGKIPWDMHQVKIDWSVRSVFKKGNNKNIARACVKELQNKKYEEYCQMYTDGSKSGTEVGLGVVCQELQIEAGLLTQCSVYSAEAAALAVAVQTADNRATVIFSDSASCMDAIKKGDSKHPFQS